jgi:hypothetical protein
LAYVTLYEKGCSTPLLAAYDKFIKLDGNSLIRMTRNWSPGYKLKVCIKFDFTDNSPGSSSGSSANEDGSASTSGAKIVYSIK